MTSGFSADGNHGRSKRRVFAVIAISAAAAAILILVASVTLNGGASLTSVGSNQVVSSDGKNSEQTRHIVPPDQIVSGGPPRDGIPSIDNPKFVSSQDAGLQDSDLVLGLNINGDIRAYPLKILVWHEIVNDNVGGTHVAVTYCPLCFTNQVFNRTIDGQVVEFGTSGKLYNSNLVMYDRTSESLWSQAMAKGIAGKYADKDLERIPFDVAFWNEWKQLYPETKVLSADTGFGRPYGADPYDDYYTDPDILFPVSHQDDRLGPKEIVIGLEHNDTFRAYRLQQIEDSRIINDEIDGRNIVLISLHPFMVRAYDRFLDGQVLDFQYAAGRVADIQTSSVWNFEGEAIEGEMKGKRLSRLPFDQGFWFSWVAFHPDTSLYN